MVMLAAIFLVYTGRYYHAAPEAEAMLRSDGTVSVTRTDYGWYFDGPSERDALIFYPGAKVEETAYAPLLHRLARQGMDVCLVRMPFRLAFLGMDRADQVMDGTEHENWYIGGHSLGGAVASIEVKAHPGVYTGMILLASFSNEDLRDEPIRVLSVYGSEDRVLNRDKYEQAKSLLPDDVTETVIDGGCHAYFGMYGAQNGDGTPSITNAEQIRITANAITDWLNNSVSSGASAD
jgi:hypothetical protein